MAASAGTAGAVVPGANGELLFTRQICQTDEDPCWELVVADATDAQGRKVDGPRTTSLRCRRMVGPSPSIGTMTPTVWQPSTSRAERLRELTPGGLDGQIPNWSPDGRRIVFQGFDDQGVDVWAVNPDGTGLTQVTRDGLSLNRPTHRTARRSLSVT
jgi:hypothetical protein